MADIVSAETRSKMMASIRRRDTKPEIMVRKELHAAGFRFRLDVRTLPGSPDIVLSKWRTVIFVHGCFWHRHAGCAYASTPATRPEFWQAKFAANVMRDLRNEEALLEQGWKVAVVWECGLSPRVRDGTIKGLVAFIRRPASPPIRSSFPETPPRPI
ncbi:very short patch repair endonuclease [Antarcticimicrobium luteum]|uniref:DNA mismatch endonuclease Vsr n=1 Tax=Antarcticimicrobium luteum TaxID=2547397 RepID=A0A4R5VH25_9RHOB|nr:very short patch repair endonuclease [Antarcticimicrobium luteum]TDK53346.1 DNA mismatch endonuclease Vsr [Antarcticimicrobium luteum]